MSCSYFGSGSLLISTPREDHNAAGGPSFKQYLNNPIFELIVSETTQIMYVYIEFRGWVIQCVPYQDSSSTIAAIGRGANQCHSISCTHSWIIGPIRRNIWRLQRFDCWSGHPQSNSGAGNLLDNTFNSQRRCASRFQACHLQHDEHH